MIVRRMQDAIGTERDVRTPFWRSVRLLLADDGMGFSFHVTTIDAGAALEMQYTNHLESVYCVEGKGTIEELDTGKRHAIEPGVVYALDRHDRHLLRAATRLVLACVFNPPLHGKEVHDANGSYPAAEVFRAADVAAHAPDAATQAVDADAADEPIQAAAGERA